MLVRVLLILLLCGISVASVVYVRSTLIHAEAIRHPRRPNILVVSVCSLRRDLLSFYGHQGAAVMPNLERFFANSSTVLMSAFNPIGWTSITSYTHNLMPPDDLRRMGYLTFGYEGMHALRIPDRRSLFPPLPADLVNDNDYEKNYRPKLEFLKEQFSRHGDVPFVSVVHIKYMHYPLIDRFNADSEWDHFLTREERLRVSDLLNHPVKYHRKLPLLLMLANDPEHALAHPRIGAHQVDRTPEGLRQLTGLVSNPALLAEWQSDPEFKQDLELLLKVYRGNARHLDKMLGEILSLFGNREARENTIVMFVSDHGETHMDRGHLTHAMSLHDEALAVASAIQVPGHSSAIPFEEQIHLESLARWLQGVANGRFDPANFIGQLHEVREDVFLTRDCTYSQRGLRLDNRYKYIVDVASGERRLFDLKADPSETRDIGGQDPDLLDQMEARFWEAYPKFSTFDVSRCAPWPGQDEKTVSR